MAVTMASQRDYDDDDDDGDDFARDYREYVGVM